jgi:predicted kinase
MRMLQMTRGLPGSGKSTYAWEKAQATNVFVTCKDDIRKKLVETGWKWSQENEQDVINEQNAQIVAAFVNGFHTVIVADTNFGKKHENRLRDIARRMKAEFEIIDFTDVPVETCVERDSKRENPVGADVIWSMYKKYLLPQAPVEIEPYIEPLDKPSAIICDLDGTLALHTGRSPYDFKRVAEDKVNKPIRTILEKFAADGYHIIYLTGRDDSCRMATVRWLDDNQAPPGILLMRQSGDKRSGSVVKLEIFDEEIRHNYRVIFTLEDLDTVVKMWRDLGLCCLQVSYGAK